MPGVGEGGWGPKGEFGQGQARGQQGGPAEALGVATQVQLTSGCGCAGRGREEPRGRDLSRYGGKQSVFAHTRGMEEV